MIVVVTGHLLAVDFAMAAPVVCLWLQLSGRRQPLARRLDRSLLKLSLAALGVAVPLGIAAAGLVWVHSPVPYGQAFSMLPRRRYEFGVVELVFSAGALWLAIWLGRRADERPAAEQPDRQPWFVTRWLATLVASLNLIYHFPPLFIMLGVLSTRPEGWGEPARFTTLLADREVLARLAHHLLAALVVTGTAIAWLAALGRLGQSQGDATLGNADRGDAAHGAAGQDDSDAPGALPAAVWGGRLATAALLLQVLSGLLLVAELPSTSQQAILGHDALSAGLFMAALVAAFFLLPRLAATALGHVNRRHLTGSLGLVIAIMLLMTATQQRTRDLVYRAESRPQKSGGSR